MNKIKLAVVSDLHCHPSTEKNPSTHLFTDLLRDDVNLHPVASLIEYHQDFLKDEHSNVDYLLCPGDVTNFSNLQGFISGWDYVQEISKMFQATFTYATLGNHDIDSRHKNSKYFQKIPKGIKKGYPIADEEIGTFWEKGYTFIEKDNLQLLIVNSTHYHTHHEESESPTIKGEISQSAIHEIDRYLHDKNDNSKIKIMMCHHHPIQQSEMNLGPYDFIENGEELMFVLAKYNFDLVIHGHKHYPKLKKYETDNGKSIPVLSAGSFSATNQISFTSKFNYIHIIEITKDTNQAKGVIKTPNYKYQVGWKNNSEGFDFLTGFGANKTSAELIISIQEIMTNTDVIDWNEICETLPDLRHIMPQELEEIKTSLRMVGCSLSFDDSNYPETIYNNKLLRERRNGSKFSK